MKYKVNDRVRIKSLDWYNENKDEYGNVDINYEFTFYADRSKYCGKVFTISEVFDNSYFVKEDNGDYYWTDEMIEGLVETSKFKKGDCVKCSDGSCGIIVTCDWSNSLNCYQYYIDYIGTLDAGYQSEKDLQPHTITTMNGRDIFEDVKWRHEFECPDGYIFKDENGNVINATKIVLEKKRKEYPKTYEECCEVMNYCCNLVAIKTTHKEELIRKFQFLLLYRDAYWKIAGEEMGLGKPWEPDWLDDDVTKYVISHDGRTFGTRGGLNYINYILVFPTAEMRDAFKENFDPDIEFCKELL